MKIEVSQLSYYPVKSCAGISLEKATIGEKGILLDREWAVIDAQSHEVLTQRQEPRLCLLKPTVQKTDNAFSILFETAEMPSVGFQLVDGKVEVETVFAWGPICRGVDQGDQIALWISTFLQRECRVLRFSPNFVRYVDPQIATRKTDQTAYADDCPFLLISEESLKELNSQMSQELHMDRFRPNIVVKGTTPFAEDGWKEIRIGDVAFDIVQPCGRCVITTVDQGNASKGREPLQTLAKIRNVN